MRHRTIAAVMSGICGFSGRTVTFRFLLVFGQVFFLFTLLTGSALAAVIETVEWDTKPGGSWSYTVDRPDIDNTTNTPSGGGALRMTYPAETYSTSTGGGRAEYVIPGQPTELYMGHWMKWSSPYTWNPIGTKIDYLFMRDPAVPSGGRDNFLTMVQNAGSTLVFTQQLWNAPGTQNRYPNRGSVTFQLNRWYWFEIHARLNTVGRADGLLEIWVDDVLIMQHNDVTYRTTNTPWGAYQHSPEWGGGGGTIPQNQYFWVDHTVISTTRIGSPGGGAGGDTSPPSRPVGLTFR
jgi:hypothetical protein